MLQAFHLSVSVSICPPFRDRNLGAEQTCTPGRAGLTVVHGNPCDLLLIMTNDVLGFRGTVLLGLSAAQQLIFPKSRGQQLTYKTQAILIPTSIEATFLNISGWYIIPPYREQLDNHIRHAHRETFRLQPIKNFIHTTSAGTVIFNTVYVRTIMPSQGNTCFLPVVSQVIVHKHGSGRDMRPIF